MLSWQLILINLAILFICFPIFSLFWITIKIYGYDIMFFLMSFSYSQKLIFSKFLKKFMVSVFSKFLNLYSILSWLFYLMTFMLNIKSLTQVSKLIFLNPFPLVFETGSHYESQPVLKLIMHQNLFLNF